MPDSPAQRVPTETMRYVLRTPGPQASPKALALHAPVFYAFLGCLAVAETLLLLGTTLPASWRWVEGLLYVLAAATTLLSVARRLPAQNVIACGAVIIGVSAVVVTVGAKTGAPFGPLEFTTAFGPKLLELLAWPMPFLWVALILSSRGTAKLILRPWRRNRQYGIGLLGLSALLVLLVDFALEPFAVQVRHYWTWPATIPQINWYGSPWMNFVGWLTTAALILAFASPWLIVKRPIPGQTDLHALVVWLLLNLYFTSGNALRQLWPAVAFTALAGALVAFRAWSGSRQLPPPPGPGEPGYRPGSPR